MFPRTALLLLGVPLGLHLGGMHTIHGAPSAITAIETTTLTGSSTVRSVNGSDPADVTYTGDQTAVTAFTSGGTRYVSDAQGQVIVRRNTAPSTFPTENVDQVGTWNYQISYAPPNVSIYGEYHNVFAAHLGQNNLHTGIENALANSGGGGNLAMNVERIDYLFDTPLLITTDHRIGVFERGGGGGGSNNGFGIAAITGVGVIDPTAYSDPVMVPLSAWSTAPALLASAAYDVYRYEVDGGPDLDARSENSAQHLVGLAIPATDLVTAGTQIYGYSIFAEDVTAATGTDLVDWTNAAIFPTNTSLADGDLDLSALGAQLWTVPEPSLMVLCGVAGAPFLRRRRAHAPGGHGGPWSRRG